MPTGWRGLFKWRALFKWRGLFKHGQRGLARDNIEGKLDLTGNAPIDPMEVDRGSLAAPVPTPASGQALPDGAELQPAPDSPMDPVDFKQDRIDPADILFPSEDICCAPIDDLVDAFDDSEPPRNPPVPERPEVEGWVMPHDPEVTIIEKGLYKGRPKVGNPGGMAGINPTILPDLAGGYRPDTVVDAGFISDEVYVGAVSLRGPGHHHMEIARQDQYSVGIEGDWFIGVVADGVSEGRYLSHLAADRAATVALSEIRKRIRTSGSCDDWAGVAEACRSQVRRFAEQTLGGRMRDPSSGEQMDVTTTSDAKLAKLMSTTCDVVICRLTPDANGDRFVVRATIAGDGCAYRLDPKRGWLQIGDGKAEASGLKSNSVVPLPVDPGPPRVTTATLGRGEALVLCTDGIGELIDEGLRPVAQYLFRKWAQPLDTVELLRSASFVNINGGDDRTAIIVWAVK